MSMQSYAAAAIVLEEKFVRATVRKELDRFTDLLEEQGECLHSVGHALSMQDYGELVHDNADEVVAAHQAMTDAFKQKTGLTLLHVMIADDAEGLEIEDGHHFSVLFDEVYEMKPVAKKIAEQLNYTSWTTFG